jgi:Glycosyl transferase family 11
MDTCAEYHDTPSFKRPASPNNCSIRSALVKRIRLDKTVDARNSAKSTLSASDAVDLCVELVKRAGLNPDVIDGDPDTLARLLETHYSTKIAEVIFRIASSLDFAEHADGQRADVFTKRHAVALYDSDFSDTDGPCIPHDYDHDVADALSKMDSSNIDQLVPDGPLSFCRKLALATLPDVEQKSLAPVDKARGLIPSLETDFVAPLETSKAYNKDTEIAISRIFDLGKVAAVQNPGIPPFAPYHGPSVVSMSGFGELGRFGNQVLQYAFLRIYAARHSISQVQVPAWVGSGLFGLQDRPVQRALPAVIEYRGAKANSTFTTEFMDYIAASNQGHDVPSVGPSTLDAAVDSKTCPVNVDLWGWFQWHTSSYAPFKRLIQDTFSPVPVLDRHLTEIFNRELRFRGGMRRTVVGLHLRLGDYKNISASSFGYCAPTSWYLEWLAKIWPTLENPILFVASDDIDAVLRDFVAYSPMTADMIGLDMPQSMSALKAGFYPDWWGLTQCDRLAISNSTFSFTACMMNEQPQAQFFRAHYADRIVAFDPWNSDPIVHRDMGGGGLTNAFSTLKVVYDTQGTSGLVRNMLFEIPYYGIRAGIMKAVLWRETLARQKVACAAALCPPSVVA